MPRPEIDGTRNATSSVMLPMTLLSFLAAFFVALGAGGAWLAGASDLASTLGVIAALAVALSLAVTIATRITLGVLATRDPQLKKALRRFERMSLVPRPLRTLRSTRT